jgi:hypothetical protein
MPTALPEEPWISADDVGEFRQGSPASRWALARYLVGRAIAESLTRTLLLAAAVLLGLAALCYWGAHVTVAAVLLALVGFGVLLLRTGLRAVLFRLTAVDRYGPVEGRLRQLVRDTRADVRRELRRVGLPSHTATLPLLAIRLAGKRRKATLARLREFRVDRVVPQARLDELHMLIRSAAGGGLRRQ